jgi:hypothetical protein
MIIHEIFSKNQGLTRLDTSCVLSADLRAGYDLFYRGFSFAMRATNENLIVGHPDGSYNQASFSDRRRQITQVGAYSAPC